MTAERRIVSVLRSRHDGRSGTAEQQETTESSLHDVRGTTTLDGHFIGRNARVTRHDAVRLRRNYWKRREGTELLSRHKCLGTDFVALRTGLCDSKT